MFFPPFHVLLTPEQLSVGQYNTNGDYGLYLGLEGGDFQHGECALYLDSRATDVPVFKGVRAIGGEGIFLSGTGIVLGWKSGRFHMKGFSIAEINNN